MAEESKLFAPSLEQQIHGVAYGKYRLGENLIYCLIQLEDLVFIACELGFAAMPMSENHPAPNVGLDFQNKIFEMRLPRSSNDCDCRDADKEDDVGHSETCPLGRPNFRYGNMRLWWYRRIGDAMSVNRPITRSELRRIFRHCQDSLIEASATPTTTAAPPPQT